MPTAPTRIRSHRTPRSSSGAIPRGRSTHGSTPKTWGCTSAASTRCATAYGTWSNHSASRSSTTKRRATDEEVAASDPITGGSGGARERAKRATRARDDRTSGASEEVGWGGSGPRFSFASGFGFDESAVATGSRTESVRISSSPARSADPVFDDRYARSVSRSMSRPLRTSSASARFSWWSARNSRISSAAWSLQSPQSRSPPVHSS